MGGRPVPVWNEIAQALREVDAGLSSRVLEWPVEAVVHAGLEGSADFAVTLGVDGPGTWAAGKNGLVDSPRTVDGVPAAGVEVMVTAAYYVETGESTTSGGSCRARTSTSI